MPDGDTVGFWSVDVDASDPVHNHAVALLELAVSVAVPVAHIGPLFVAPVDVGVAFTVTVVGYTVVGWQPLGAALTVSE